MKKRVEKEKEQSGVGRVFSKIFFVLSVIIGVISVMTAVMGFLTGSILIGSLYLILGVFTFIPKRVIKIPTWLKFLIALAVFIILIVVDIVLNYHATAIINHNMQEEFILVGRAANMSAIVYNTTKTTSISVDNQKETTEGYFLFVNCAFTNLGEGAVTMTPTYDIIDNQNKSYTGMGFSGSEDVFQPDLKKQVYFLFEMPSSAQGLKFRILDAEAVHAVGLGM